MNAREEAQDLMQNPLPTLVIMDPLTRVYELDNIIAKMESALTERREERQQFLDYAVKNNVREDDRCQLEEKIKRFRSLNIDRFREVFPQEYDIACSIERKEKMEALDHIGEKVNLTLVDKLVKKAALEAAQGVVSVKESISYQVVRK